MKPNSQATKAIAPCGMNCMLCMAYHRKTRPCHGCNGPDDGKPGHCRSCSIRKCPVIGAGESGFCYECDAFPCRRLRDLDKRYRTKYHMSMIENLTMIRDRGMPLFLLSEAEKWTCNSCGGWISVHLGACARCGAAIPGFFDGLRF